MSWQPDLAPVELEEKMEQQELPESYRDELRRFSEVLKRRAALKRGEKLPPAPAGMKDWLLGKDVPMILALLFTDCTEHYGEHMVDLGDISLPDARVRVEEIVKRNHERGTKIVRCELYQAQRLDTMKRGVWDGTGPEKPATAL